MNKCKLCNNKLILEYSSDAIESFSCLKCECYTLYNLKGVIEETFKYRISVEPERITLFFNKKEGSVTCVFMKNMKVENAFKISKNMNFSSAKELEEFAQKILFLI
jgi:hypothetical protein